MKLSFLKIESYKKGIFYSSSFNLVAKVLAFVTSLTIAFYFGTQSKTDLYFYCFSIISLIAGFITNVDGSVLIPESMRLREQQNSEESRRFLNFFLYIYLAAGILIITIIYIDPVSILVTLSNFKRGLLEQNKSILLLSVPLFALIVICTFLIDILSSYKFFTVPLIAQMLNNIFAIAFILLFHNNYGVLSILFGILFAYSVQLCLLIFLMKKYLNWEFIFKTIPLSKKVLKNILFAQSGNVTSTLSGYIPLYLLSGFGAGIITALNYGQKTADLPNQFITTQFSSVTGIKFNELVAKGDFVNLNNIFNRSAKFLLFVLTPISCIIFIYNHEIINILYKRGNFDSNSVKFTAEFLKYFALLLPFLAINTLVTRLFMAHQKIKEAFWYQISFNILITLLIIVNINYWGSIGYPLALLIAHTMNYFLIYYLMKLYFKELHYEVIIKDLLKILSLNIFMSFNIYTFKEYTSGLYILLQISVCCFLYLTILLLINQWLNIIPFADIKNIFIKTKLLDAD